MSLSHVDIKGVVFKAFSLFQFGQRVRGWMQWDFGMASLKTCPLFVRVFSLYKKNAQSLSLFEKRAPNLERQN